MEKGFFRHPGAEVPVNKGLTEEDFFGFSPWHGHPGTAAVEPPWQGGKGKKQTPAPLARLRRRLAARG